MSGFVSALAHGKAAPGWRC